MAGPPTVLIVSDHVFAARGLRHVAQAALKPAVIAEEPDPQLAVRHAKVARADLVLVDLAFAGPAMPSALAAQLHRQVPRAKVVVVLPLSRVAEIERCLLAGAHACLPADPPAGDLAHRLRALVAENAQLDDRLADVLVRDIRTVYDGRVGPVQLTRRERDTLELVAQGCSNRVIAERLHVGEATVKSHVSRLLKKLGASSRTQAVARAHDAGLI